MSSPLWSGNVPQTKQDAKTRLCIAALDCIKRHGYEKTTMSDIAKEAGIARPTLYKHYKTKLDMLYQGIDTVAYAFAQSVVEHARQFKTLEDRIIETIVFTVREFPKDPYLSLALSHDCSHLLRDRAFSDEATLVFSEMTSAPLIEINPDLANDGVEISEIMSRFAISMILFPGKYINDDKGLRSLIKKRVLPGLI